LNFIGGKRTESTAWCDWNIPLHIGGLSDPFQPIEKEKRVTYKCLEVLAKYKYPFVISTKATLAATKEYLEVLRGCDFVYQVSMLCSEFDKFEEGAPSYEERLKSLIPISKIAKRVVIRLQPYLVDYHKQILENIKRLKDHGVYGVVVEGVKMQKKMPGLIKIGADFCYPKKLLKHKFLEIKKECRKHGLAFFCGENRLRGMGDSLCCCGTEGLDGYRHNTANLNHYLYERENYKFTEQMETRGTAMAFRSIAQRTVAARALSQSSYADIMQLCTRDRDKLNIFIGE
jgi:DNA repair photolyase